MTTVFVAGAGASKAAGLPLTDAFIKKMLDVKGLKEEGPSARLVQFLTQFVDDVFGNGGHLPDEEWPSLEDAFTIVDMAANTGHHLGPKYSAAELRSVRRCFLLRMIRMIEILYRQQKKRGGAEWDALQRLFRTVDIEQSAFLTMNWDTVVEDGLWREQAIRTFDYRCGARAAVIDQYGDVQLSRRSRGSTAAVILKPHGSINWMYCDACRQLFWFEPGNGERIAARLFKDSDRSAIRTLTGKRVTFRSHKVVCPTCQANALASRFATFSYKKALSFPMYEATWRDAEVRLRKANNWVFFGYSMPSADFEFKYMLKSAFLGRLKPPRIILITGGGGAHDTVANYSRYFGGSSIKEKDIFTDGLTQRTLDQLSSVGALDRL